MLEPPPFRNSLSPSSTQLTGNKPFLFALGVFGKLSRTGTTFDSNSMFPIAHALTYQVPRTFSSSDMTDMRYYYVIEYFHEKSTNYRPCSRISRNKLVISRITGVLSFTDHGKNSFFHDSRNLRSGRILASLSYSLMLVAR